MWDDARQLNAIAITLSAIATAFFGWAIVGWVTRLPAFEFREVVVTTPLVRLGAILVNQGGHRFGDETADLTLATAQQPDGSAFIIFDWRVLERFSRWPHFVSTAPGAGYAYVQDYRRHRRDLWHEGNSIDALARSLGIPAEIGRASCRERV